MMFKIFLSAAVLMSMNSCKTPSSASSDVKTVRDADFSFKCQSEPNQSLYFSVGTLTVSAKSSSAKELQGVKLSLSASDLGGTTSRVAGTVKGGWVRFDLDQDAWCAYRFALPNGFEDRSEFPAFVDAHCEANSKSSVRLDCTRE